jgi:5-formaminoimidazole-4-carboxamide-1-beta-D-ribofuranosyl 5'-monophosphate synthetase
MMAKMIELVTELSNRIQTMKAATAATTPEMIGAFCLVMGVLPWIHNGIDHTT